MKQHLCTSVVLSIIFTGIALMAAETQSPPSPSALRAKAKKFFTSLPSKMPGAEKDTPAMINLGQKLYFEKRLSVNQQMSCNTCHKIDKSRAGVDNEPTSEGVHGKRGDRNSPTTLNAGFHVAQFWDGRAKTLEDQAKGPVLNPVEMAMPSETEVLARLSQDQEYPGLFRAAFPGEANPLTYENFGRAVAAFERTLITRDRFDDFHKGDDAALNAQELRGLDLFLAVGCTTCHMGPTIGANAYQKIGIFHQYPNTKDRGRAQVTNEEWDEFRFKVPSLRNVALTWPYFHDGQAATLSVAIKQMAYLQLDRQLPDNDLADLTEFLSSLSDKSRQASK